jgi:glycosyltransferase involved in cell wall biosynthesis
MLGAHPFRVKGGVSACARNILCSDLTKYYNIVYIPTMVDGSWILKVIIGIKAIFRFLKYISSYHILIVHVHGSKGVSLYRKAIFVLLAKWFKKKLIFHCHSGKFDRFYEQGPDIQKFLIKKVITSSDCVIALTERWASFFEKFLSKEKIKVLPNSVHAAIYDRYRRQVKKSKRPTIIFAGIFSENKGIYDLLSVMLGLKEKVPEIRLLLAGDKNIDKIKRFIKTNSLEQNVEIVGWVSPNKLISLYCESHIFVLPSYYEGLPMVLIEAMACGLPVVSTKVGGIPEIIEEGVNGFLVTPGDRKALFEKLLILSKDLKLCLRMGENNASKIKKEYDISTYSRKLKQIYDNLIKRE